MSCAGLLLAAGAGKRFGTPKALVDDWLSRAVTALADGGCAEVTVVLGASAAEAREKVPAGVEVVVAEDWAEGMSASLRTGLAHLDVGHEAVVVDLVDLPDLTAEVVRRVVETHTGPRDLARASFAGRPGHPVLIGRDHWGPVIDTARGDSGARDYLSRRVVRLVECGDLATGRDVDVPAEQGLPSGVAQ